jgi:signal transduction histidine kinase
MKFRAKLVGFTLLLILLVGAGVVGGLRLTLGSKLEHELQRRGVAIAKYVAADCVTPLITEDRVAAQLVVNAGLGVEEDVAYIFVQDSRGAVVVHTFGEAFPAALRDANPAAGDGSGPRVRHVQTVKGDVYDIALPLVRGQLGTIRVGMLSTAVRASVNRVLQVGIAVIVASVLLFGGMVLAADLVITRNLAALSEAVRALGVGDLGHRLPAGGRDDFGELSRAFNAMADNLERSEEKLVDLNTVLLREVRDRKIAEEEVRKAYLELARQNEELTKLDRLRDGFIRDVSHELKTPVAKHAMQLEILRAAAERGGFIGAVEPVLAVMQSSVRRQQQVIKNLLGLARLESGVRGYRREPVRLDDVIRSVAEDYGPVLEARGVTLGTDLQPVGVESDGEMLWHVFSNLVNNAIKFQKGAHGGRIDVSVRAEGGNAVVRVHDEGIGLGPEEKAKVFEKFYQATASTEGSGVGLTICRMIVEGVGGRIWFESDGPGRGATAVVTLPLPGEAPRG